MGLPNVNSFTPLAILHLTGPYILHPDGCNPAMDLVVLLSPPQEHLGTEAPLAKAGSPKLTTRVALWRMSGTKVWEVELEGDVDGLAWSLDGLHLTLLMMQYPALPTAFLLPGQRWKAKTATLEHLSVHNGSIVRSLPCRDVIDSMDEADRRDLASGNRWWNMEWVRSGVDWQKENDGSAGMIIDSLPNVTPVEPPRHANALPFMIQKVDTTLSASTFAIHSKLQAFPSLLPANPRAPPDVLWLSPPSKSKDYRFLTGTFPIPSSSDQHSAIILSLSRVVDRMSGFLHVILRGLEAAEHAFRDGEKQTLIWREELETCAEQQGMSKIDVHADLFNFMMTGRCGVAVAEYLGSRLTGRTIAKWELALEHSFQTIQKVISESITPAIERVVLLLEELRGWAKTRLLLRSPSYCKELVLDSDSLRQAIDTTCGLAALMERMRQDAEHETQAAAEWIKWLKYEITRAAATDPSSDTLPTAMHDLKLAWSFMRNGFVASPFQRHFPSLATATGDVLPTSTDPYPTHTMPELAAVMSETMRRLSSPSQAALPSSQKTADYASPRQAERSIDSSIAMSSPSEPSHARAGSADTAQSPDTVAAKRDVVKMPTRQLDEEPLVWANTLLAQCEALVQRAVLIPKASRADPNGLRFRRDPGGESLYTERVTSEGRWIAFVPTASASNKQLWLVCLPFGDDLRILVAAFSLAVESTRVLCLAIQFFDDVELAMVLETSSHQRYVNTIEYATVKEEMAAIPLDQYKEDWTMADIAHSLAQQNIQARPSLPLTRSRLLSYQPSADRASQPITERVSLALNGRQGRRVGCITMGEGRDVEVLDMDEDEGIADDTIDHSGMDGLEDDRTTRYAL